VYIAANPRKPEHFMCQVGSNGAEFYPYPYPFLNMLIAKYGIYILRRILLFLVSAKVLTGYSAALMVVIFFWGGGGGGVVAQAEFVVV
jgi:uncharacterized membrane protein